MDTAEGTKKILIADDDPEIREALRLLLDCEGYETAEAANGEEVLRILDNTVDLVILDVMMPGMNGYAACAEIRKRSAVPVLFPPGASPHSVTRPALSITDLISSLLSAETASKAKGGR